MHIAAIFLMTLLVTAPAAEGGFRAAAEKLRGEMNSVGVATFTSPTFKPATVRHIVLFRYKDGITVEQREEIRHRLLALITECMRNGKRYIESVETGEQTSGEGVARGYEDAFIVTFKSEGDRNYYVGSPIVTDHRFADQAHERFKAFVAPFLAVKNGALVFDFSIAGSAERAEQTM